MNFTLELRARKNTPMLYLRYYRGRENYYQQICPVEKESVDFKKKMIINHPHADKINEIIFTKKEAIYQAVIDHRTESPWRIREALEGGQHHELLDYFKPLSTHSKSSIKTLKSVKKIVEMYQRKR